MKKNIQNILSKIFVGFSFALSILLGLILIRQGKFGLAILAFAAVIFGASSILFLLIGRIKLINSFYLRLFSLIASLKLEAKQDKISIQKDARSIDDLDFSLTSLEKAIESKTSELSNRNNELKAKQKEILKQNKELIVAYNALKESRDRYDKLVKNLEEEYFFYDMGLNGEILYVSPSVRSILGFTPIEFINNKDNLFTNSPINKHAREYMSKSLKGIIQPKFLIEIVDIDKVTHVLELLEIPNYNSANELISIEVLVHDITERYHTEELIKEQEEKYRQIFNTASDFIYIYSLTKDDKPGKFIETNQYTQVLLGYTYEELKNMTPDDLIAAEIWTDSHNRKPDIKYECIWLSKDSNIIHVEISEHYFMIKNQRVSIAVARDITDRKKAIEEIQFMNEELINQKENLEALVDNLTQTQEQLVQSEKMAALGQLIAGVAHEINTPLGAIKASVGNLSDSLSSALGNLPNLFQNQSIDSLNLFISAFTIARNKKQELSSREKREKKRTIRQELIEQNIPNAESIAEVLSYLEIYEEYIEFKDLLQKPDAHKILTNVRDFISLLKNTHTISIAANKAAKVVFALKKYAHRDSLGEKSPTDIIDGLETVLTLYDSQFKQGITVVKNYSTLPLVMSYQDEINQVWTNLIQNSIQAMMQSGTLTISAYSNEKNIFVSITDTGEGIEPSIMEKIFEPFFTTKKRGEGSGLGLDIVKKIVDKHEGVIDVKSKIGEGTTFTVSIPLM